MTFDIDLNCYGISFKLDCHFIPRIFLHLVEQFQRLRGHPRYPRFLCDYFLTYTPTTIFYLNNRGKKRGLRGWRIPQSGK